MRLWGEKRSVVVDLPVVVPEPKTPGTWKPKPELATDELAEYAKVATAIGLSTGAVLEEKIKRCLSENNIDCYDEDDVWDFLDAKLGKGKWVWAGLRRSDCEELDDEWNTSSGGRKVFFTRRPYSRRVPLPILLTVQKVLESVPEVHFYVSQSADENADPFLMVSSRETQNFIIERWDEPDFRER